MYTVKFYKGDYYKRLGCWSRSEISAYLTPVHNSSPMPGWPPPSDSPVARSDEERLPSKAAGGYAR